MSKNTIIDEPDFDLIIAADGTLETRRNGRRYSMSERQEFYRRRLATNESQNLSAVEMMILAGRQKEPTITEPTLFNN